MNIDEFKASLIEEVQAFNASNFTHEITTTTHVPDINDQAITFPNPSTKTQKSKLLETAVLFVDMRGSTTLSMKHQNGTALAPVYSSFVRAMSRCAHENNGYVRNIIGDRVMVVFDRKDCFRNATQTAIYMNSVVSNVLNKHIDLATIDAGIGIDFGKMLVTKNGVIKQGDENDPNKALVWLGKPANIASKLTDMANKLSGEPERQISEMHKVGLGFSAADYIWVSRTVDQFLDALSDNAENHLVHRDSSFRMFLKDVTYHRKNPPILMTEYFYNLWVKEDPEADSIKKDLWRKQDITVPGYGNPIIGGDVVKTAMQE